MEDFHSLLKRQLKHHFGPQFEAPAEWQEFLESVSTAYREFDSDRGMLERSLELSSQELIQANAETTSIIQLFPDAFLWLDQDGTILNYKSSGLNSLSWLEGIMNASQVYDMRPGVVKDILREAVRRSIETKIVSSVNFSVEAKDQPKFYEARVIPPVSNRILVIIPDVTEQKLAEESVRESERRFRELADLLPIVVFESDLEGHIIFLNRMGFEASGYTKEELTGKPIYNFIARADLQSGISDIRTIYAAGNPEQKEIMVINKQGVGVPAIVRIALIHNSRGDLIGLRGIMVDISDRKKIERELQDSEEKYRSLVENIKLGIFRAIPEGKGKFLEINNAMAEITGHSRDELLNLDAEVLYVYPDERREFIRRLLTTPEKATLICQWVKKNGTHITVYIIAQAIKDKIGRLYYLDGTIEDITERRKMEEQIIELYEKEKRQRKILQEEAKARGMFIDVLAHELRTPLTPIMVSTGILKDKSTRMTDSIREKLIENVYDTSQTLSRRLEELLDLARYSRGTFNLNLQPVDLNQFFRDMIARHKPALQLKAQKLIAEIATGLPEAEIDVSRLEQVIVNLLSNASKFSQDQGTIFFKVALVSHSFQVDIQDHGMGIPLESQSRLFEPYHRVEQDRQQFPGLGLGLAVAKQIVEAHGGKIWLVSEPDKGSIFSFQIPFGKSKTNARPN